MSDIITPQELAQDALFFERELVNVLPTIYESRRPLPNARRLLPIVPVGDPDADVFVAQRLDWVGDVTAGEVGWKNDMGVPVISASRAEVLYPVRHFKGGVSWRDKDLRKANRNGMNLETLGVERLINNFMLAENTLLWTGRTDMPGIYGVTTHPDLATPTNLPSSAAWDAGATAAEIYADLIYMAEYIQSNTSQVYTQPVTILLPWEAYRIASTRQFSVASDLTVLEYFRRNNAGLFATIEPVRELDTAKVAFAYIRDPQIAGNVLIRDVFSYAPRRYDAGYTQNYQMSTAGFVVFDNNGVRTFDQLLT
jgi:hypothetical protein